MLLMVVGLVLIVLGIVPVPSFVFMCVFICSSFVSAVVVWW